MDEQLTPFNAKHIAAGAKIVPFAGYRMPLFYTGIQQEHLAVRESAGLFDLSHMGEFFCRGAGAADFLQRMTTNDIFALAENQVQYTAMCLPEGGIVDDLLVYRLADGYMLVPNAANIDKDWDWLCRHKPDSVQLTNASESTGMLAIQGPDGEAIVAGMTDYALAELGSYWSARARFGRHELLFSRTGYTGEDGFEIYCPTEAAHDLWDLAMRAGQPRGMALVGLGARDSLRLEMRYALYGQDIDAETNPIAAGLGWICKPDKGEFIGRAAIVAMKQAGPREKLVCLELGPRAIPRPSYKVCHNGRTVGHVRSGLFSPSLACGIATAYVPRALTKPGTQLEVEMRGRHEPATVVKPPFYKNGSHR